MTRKINYPALASMAIGFSHANSMLGAAIRFFRKSNVNHAFIITQDHGQFFATEETVAGLRENSLETYNGKKDGIIKMYFWKGFEDSEKTEAAQTYLAEIRRRNGEDSKYDFNGLFHFLPVIGRFFKPSKDKQWCSENCASIMKKFGAGFIDSTEIAPDELLELMEKSDECIEVTNFYC